MEPLDVRFDTVDEVVRTHILYVLHAVGGNKKRAAQVLKIGRGTLYRRLAEYEYGVLRRSDSKPTVLPEVRMMGSASGE